LWNEANGQNEISAKRLLEILSNDVPKEAVLSMNAVRNLSVEVDGVLVAQICLNREVYELWPKAQHDDLEKFHGAMGWR